MSLSPRQYHDLLDELYRQLEDSIDDSELDADIENSGGVLTIELPDASQLILSRQEPLLQLWLATRSGGFHFDYQPEQQRWYCAEHQQELGALLSQLISASSGVSLALTNPL